jgi:sulfhydrogenase subunit beta (sulfur reductase)
MNPTPESAMVSRSLGQAQLEQLLEQLLAQGVRLIAPVRREGRLFFEQVSSTGQIVNVSDYVNTEMPPKEFLFPRTEPIVEFERGGDGKVQLHGVEPEVVPTVLFGVRPCDAAGISILEQVFNWDYADEFFLKRLEKTTVVAVSCTDPEPWCFCTAVGYGPTSNVGSDLLLTRVAPETFLAEGATPKGKRFLEQFGDLFGDEPGEKGRATREAEARFTRTGKLVAGGKKLRDAFGDERWRRIGGTCLSCGACAYSCPSCHCFDIIDEADLHGGRRLKIWDTCCSETFTLHGAGHNPRPTQPTRYRQRVLHKFSYFPERFGRVMCVGCGRCQLNCPVGIDIYEAAREFLAPQQASQAQGAG